MSTYLNLFVTRKYGGEGNAEEKTQFIKVGAAFPHKNGEGFGIEVTEGISVSGSLVALPPQDKDNENGNRSNGRRSK